MNQLDAAAIRLAALGAGVDRRARAPSRRRAAAVRCSRSAAAASVDLLAPLALDALAIVVELGGLAQQPIVIVVALPLELAGVRGRPTADASSVRRRLMGPRVGLAWFNRSVGDGPVAVDARSNAGSSGRRPQEFSSTLLMARDRLSTALIARE